MGLLTTIIPWKSLNSISEFQVQHQGLQHEARFIKGESIYNWDFNLCFVDLFHPRSLSLNIMFFLFFWCFTCFASCFQMFISFPELCVWKFHHPGSSVDCELMECKCWKQGRGVRDHRDQVLLLRNLTKHHTHTILMRDNPGWIYHNVWSLNWMISSNFRTRI